MSRISRRPFKKSDEGDEGPVTLQMAHPEESRRIWVTSFSQDAVKSFSNAVLNAAERDESEPIVIYIDSYGGEVAGCLGMISVMEAVPNPTLTIAVGKAMSAGAVLLSNGNVRCAAPHVRLMLHEASGGGLGNVNDAEAAVEELRYQNEYMLEILARNCGYKSTKELKKLFSNERRDRYLSAHEAKKIHLIDHVGVPMIERRIGFGLKFSSKNAKKASKNAKKAS